MDDKPGVSESLNEILITKTKMKIKFDILIHFYSNNNELTCLAVTY